jgi:hypothetical protein
MPSGSSLPGIIGPIIGRQPDTVPIPCYDRASGAPFAAVHESSREPLDHCAEPVAGHADVDDVPST